MSERPCPGYLYPGYPCPGYAWRATIAYWTPLTEGMQIKCHFEWAVDWASNCRPGAGDVPNWVAREGSTGVPSRALAIPSARIGALGFAFPACVVASEFLGTTDFPVRRRVLQPAGLG
jgi:hypothetical protein